MTPMSNSSKTSPVSDMTNPSSSAVCNKQQVPDQQELIRLLAQHFNQQVYQLASANSISNATEPETNNNNNAISNLDGIHKSLSNLQQQQYRSNQGTINQAKSTNVPESIVSQTLDDTSRSVNQTFLAGQILRSHLPFSIPALKSTDTASSNQLDRRNLDNIKMEQQHIQSNNYPQKLFHDMNVFNALNYLNINNDQLMFSLQQQYLLQAASSTNTHCGFNNPFNNHLPDVELSSYDHLSHYMQTQANSIQQQHQQQQKMQLDLRTNQRSKRNQDEHLNSSRLRTQEESRTELLKFSINTILGQSSPVTRDQKLENQHSNKQDTGPLRLSGTNLDLPINDKSGEKVFEAYTNVTELSSPECDPNVTTDLSSDSDSRPTTPLNQQLSDIIEPNGTFNEHYKDRNHTPGVLNSNNHIHGYRQISNPEQHRPAIINQQSSQHPHPHHHSTLAFLAGSTAFPWTAAARGKPRRGMMRRAVFSDSQRVGLEKRFQLQKYISKPDRKKLAEKLGLRDSQVKIWFQNRRMKWRNSKERELLSAGGSREQTLPTRNNPNPDLSDVGETIKKITSTSDSNTM